MEASMGLLGLPKPSAEPDPTPTPASDQSRRHAAAPPHLVTQSISDSLQQPPPSSSYHLFAHGRSQTIPSEAEQTAFGRAIDDTITSHDTFHRFCYEVPDSNPGPILPRDIGTSVSAPTSDTELSLTKEHQNSPPLMLSFDTPGETRGHEPQVISPDVRLSLITVQVDELGLESRIAAQSVKHEIARNRGDLAQTRGEVQDIGKQFKETSQFDKQRSNLERLPVAPGATYDESLGCMKGTRTNIIGEVLDFLMRREVGETRVFLLTGCAGAGKTAIAHSVARICDLEYGCLGASFIFQAGETLRNNPTRFISTIARELSARYPAYASQLSDAIETNPSITQSSPSNQLRSLLLLPASRTSPPSGPMAIVVDAIDEGWSEQLLHVVKSFSELPSWIRVFITLRDDGFIIPRLRCQAHIHRRELDITSDTNLGDVRAYIEQRLRTISDEREISDWPVEAVERMSSQANGLFVWAAVACNSISNPDLNPVSQYEELVSGGRNRDTVASNQMDELYMKVLSKCDLNEPRAIARFHQCLGTIVALKRPLSASAIDELNGTDHTLHTLRKFNPVLFGLERASPPSVIQIIHHSFREFITRRSTDTSATYVIAENEHHESLALNCLRIICREMPLLADQTQWIIDKKRSLDSGVPSIPEGAVSEALWYACEYVMELIEAVPSTVSGLSDALVHFMRENLFRWLAVRAMKGNCWGLEILLHHVQDVVDVTFLAEVMYRLSRNLAYDGRLEEALLTARMSVSLYRAEEVDTKYTEGSKPGIFHHIFSRLSLVEYIKTTLTTSLGSVYTQSSLLRERRASLAMSLNNLSSRLSNLGQHDQALEVSRESVTIRRELARGQPARFNPGLALSLNNLTAWLSNLGRHDEALTVSRESVNLYRDLAREHPSAFIKDLALSLYNLSVQLFNLSQHDEALAVLEESVNLRRNLARDNPAAFNKDLALSLNALSVWISNLGHNDQALAVSQESANLNRDLARDRPAMFNPELARSLNNLSLWLSNLGRTDEALTFSRESVAIRRDLARDRPAVFAPELARSLNNLSMWLSKLGQYDEALMVSQESVDIRRRLARDQPAAFNKDLASSLNSLSCQLSSLGQYEKALSAARESVDLRRDLARNRPHFQIGLAYSLDTLSVPLSRLGRLQEAIEASRESATLIRPFAKDQPAAEGPALAEILLNLTTYFPDDEDGVREALLTCREAEMLYRPLAERNTREYQSKWKEAYDLLDGLKKKSSEHDAAG